MKLAQLPSAEIDSATAHFLEEAEASKFDFNQVSVKAAGDERLRLAVNNAVVKNDSNRQLKLTELPDSDRLRSLAGDIKQHTLDNLDYYLEQLKANVEKNGGKVYFASTAEQARKIVLDICVDGYCGIL